MINPVEKLKAKQQEFISIRELINRISRLHPAMSQAHIANWLLIELTDARPLTPPLLIKDALGVIRTPSSDDPQFCYLDLLSAAMANPEMDGAPCNKYRRTDYPADGTKKLIAGTLESKR
ncbi:hypothetical protein [Yersinia alsatica]|uniref:hypothetical protein n=1 Tax=Yersinia alsatica TaxID=2890317 RepID=UPI0026B484EC|nr:hypothetical protein [Yersinia alsatica]